MNQISSILQKATRNKLDRLNIITFPTHERHASCMSNINADFFLFQGSGIKTWEDKYAKLPKNHVLLNPKFGNNQLPDYITPDISWSQNKLAHYAISVDIAKRYKIPLINLEHCLPWLGITQKQLEQLYKMQGDVNVFISDYSRRAWGYNETNSVVIEHGLDNNFFAPYNTDKIYDTLAVANDFRNRNTLLGWDEYQYIIKSLPNNNHKLVGSNPGYSLPANGTQELVQFYNQSKIFLCTAKISPIPFSLIESMSCGIPAVCYKQAMVSEAIKHGYNGMISDNVDELVKYTKQLLEDENMRKEIGNNARKTAIERFNLNRFTKEWEHVFRSLI